MVDGLLPGRAVCRHGQVEQVQVGGVAGEQGGEGLDGLLPEEGEALLRNPTDPRRQGDPHFIPEGDFVRLTGHAWYSVGSEHTLLAQDFGRLVLKVVQQVDHAIKTFSLPGRNRPFRRESDERLFLLPQGNPVDVPQHDRHLQVLWLYTVTINTIYSFLWDVLMDWGLCMQSNSKYPFLRDKLLYSHPAVYYLAIFMDLALRLCWSLKLSSHLQHHASGLAFIFLFEILEIFRRFVWNFFRVEWQVISDEQKRQEVKKEEVQL